jgi:hypothetical protein
MTSRTHHACTHSQLHGDASPERFGEASSHGSGQRPAKDPPGGASVHHRPCHTSVTNYADATGPQSPDLLQCTHHGLAWTPINGLYNLCHVVPSDGPRTRTGASSGPSTRYCRVFGGVSLTRQTLSCPTGSHAAGWNRRLLSLSRRLRGGNCPGSPAGSPVGGEPADSRARRGDWPDPVRPESLTGVGER